MEPLSINMDHLFDGLVAVIVLSFFVERALAIVFEHRLWATRMAGKGFKTPIAFFVAWGVCIHWNFDAISIVLPGAQPRVGYLLTAAIIAGGSKASIKLFHDVIGAMSDAEKKRKNQP